MTDLELLAQYEAELEHGHKNEAEIVEDIERKQLYKAAGFDTFDAWGRARWGDRWGSMVPKTLRQKMTAKKRAEGKSLRQIGGELGISDGTVRNDLGTAQDYAVPDRIVGLDGRAQPATRQKKPPSRPGANKWSKRVEAISASVDMDELTDDQIEELWGAADFLRTYCAGALELRRQRNGA